MAGSGNSRPLHGRWRIRPDPGNVGLAEGWFRAPDEFLNEAITRPVDVPGAWQHALGEAFHGVAWYRTRIDVPADWSFARRVIRFDAVATAIDAWVNGRHVGSHVGDYIPFEFDVSADAKPGSTVDLVLRVDEAPGHITKGFHDMLSIHHGGVWGDVRLERSGACFARPNGVWIDAELATGVVHVRAELGDGSARRGELRGTILGPDGAAIASANDAFDTSSREGEAPPTVIARLEVPSPRAWSQADPYLYGARVEILDSNGGIDEHTLRFGFRSIETRGTHILLNGSPVHLRGVLHWGHEPRHLAPAPPPEQVRREFAMLKAMGFNAVCLCMWYPPSHYHDIADEMGMLIWQEHPNWHAPMTDALLPEYRRLYEEFLRRDRRHPSVVIVSATCEHPSFHPDLASWWWNRAREMLPRHLLQVQTSSFAWSDPSQTDLYDEHTYDNNNRWVTYLRDLQEKLAELPPKPFVMGETILFTSWPDVRSILAASGQSRAWSLPKCHESVLRAEHRIRAAHGEETLARFKRQADRHHLLGRKFQVELFRRYPNHAALVTNHIIDVPGCTCGFMDALGRWRFKPEQTRGWLADAPLLLATPDERRSFTSGERAACRLLVSNFSRQAIREVPSITINGAPVPVGEPISASVGEVAGVSFKLDLPNVSRPTRFTVRASLSGGFANKWDWWVFPPPAANSIPGAYRFEGLPFDNSDAVPDPLERGYSRGFGLPVRTWIGRLPEPGVLAPRQPAFAHGTRPPADARVVLTHRLTRQIIEHIDGGGCALLLASKAPGGLGTNYEWLFGQCPLVVEQGMLEPGDSEWVVDLLGMDLTRTYARVIPVEDLGLADRVDPIIRLVYSHDQESLKFFDMLFAVRVGSGVLAVSSLDHHDPAGQHILDLALRRLATDSVHPCGEIDPRWLAARSHEAASAPRP
jgi:hypothetical protein